MRAISRRQRELPGGTSSEEVAPGSFQGADANCLDNLGELSKETDHRYLSLTANSIGGSLIDMERWSA